MVVQLGLGHLKLLREQWVQDLELLFLLLWVDLLVIVQVALLLFLLGIEDGLLVRLLVLVLQHPGVQPIDFEPSGHRLLVLPDDVDVVARGVRDLYLVYERFELPSNPAFEL